MAKDEIELPPKDPAGRGDAPFLKPISKQRSLTATSTDETGRTVRKVTDENGNRIKQLYISTDHFEIYSALSPDENDYHLSILYPDDYASAHYLRGLLSGLSDRLANIQDVIAGIRGSQFRFLEGKSRTMHERAMDMMARAVQMAFEGQQKRAEALLDRALKQVSTCRDSRNRMRYIFANLIALMIILGFWALERGGATDLPAFLAANPQTGVPGDGVRVMDVLALGALGAFFSVSTTLQSIKVEHSLSFQEILYAGFVRIPIGLIAAGVTILLISGAWILGTIEESLRPWNYCLFGFLAGFSEYFVPNALRRVEQESRDPARTDRRAVPE